MVGALYYLKWHLPRRDNTLLIGLWDHYRYAARRPPELQRLYRRRRAYRLQEIRLQWFDYTLKAPRSRRSRGAVNCEVKGANV